MSSRTASLDEAVALAMPSLTLWSRPRRLFHRSREWKSTDAPFAPTLPPSVTMPIVGAIVALRVEAALEAVVVLVGVALEAVVAHVVDLVVAEVIAVVDRSVGVTAAVVPVVASKDASKPTTIR